MKNTLHLLVFTFVFYRASLFLDPLIWKLVASNDSFREHQIAMTAKRTVVYSGDAFYVDLGNGIVHVLILTLACGAIAAAVMEIVNANLWHERKWQPV